MPSNSEFAKLFNPKSIAVIGASRDPKKIGHITIRNLMESRYDGFVFPINPEVSEILNIKTYPSVLSLPNVPELVIICVPSNIALNLIEDAAKFGCQNFVVYSAGFKEIGHEGEKLEQDLINLIKKYNINLLGPNCFGFVNSNLNVNATFGMGLKNRGKVKFVTQSGAIAASIFDYANYKGFGFSEFITLGNKTSINENDILDYFNSDYSATPVPVGLYLESLVDGKDFLTKVKKISTKSPAFIIKPGASDAAKKVMKSHTGSLAGEDVVLSEALKSAGVIRCENLEQLFDLTTLFSWTTPPKGLRVAVISNAGGPAVITADHVSKEGLILEPLDEKTKNYLSTKLPRSASLLNPIDLLGDALSERYKDAIEAEMQNDNVDSIIVILTPQVQTEIEKTAEIIHELVNKYKKPLVCSFIGGDLVENGDIILNKYNIPVFRYPHNAVYALASYSKWYLWSTQNQGSIQSVVYSSLNEKGSTISDILKSAALENRKILNGYEVSEIFNSIGIETANTASISEQTELLEYTKHNGYPVVLKAYGNDEKFLHKTEFKGVFTNLSNEQQVIEGFNKLKTDASSKIIIQKHVTQGIETIVGIKKDISFGYFMNFGAGGTLTELIKDVNIGLIENNLLNPKQIIEKSNVFKLLNGYRGAEKYNIDKLITVLEDLANLVVKYPVFSELEINPLIITHDKVFAVDGKAILL